MRRVMPRAVPVGVLAVGAIVGCGGSSVESGNIAATGGTAGVAGAGEPDVAESVVGFWYPCADDTCSSADMRNDDGWQFTEDGECYWLSSPPNDPEFCREGSPGDCTYEGEIIDIHDPLGPGVTSMQLALSMQDGVLSIEDQMIDGGPVFFHRIPDNLVGACRASGEPCQRNAECSTRVCSCQTSDTCDQPVCD